MKRQRTDGGRFALRRPVASESEDDQGDSVTEELDAADHSGVSCIMTTQSQVENDPTVDHEPNLDDGPFPLSLTKSTEASSPSGDCNANVAVPNPLLTANGSSDLF